MVKNSHHSKESKKIISMRTKEGMTPEVCLKISLKKKGTHKVFKQILKN